MLIMTSTPSGFDWFNDGTGKLGEIGAMETETKTTEEKPREVKVIFSLPEEVHKELRICAIKCGVSMKALVTEMVEEELRRRAEEGE